MFIKSWIFGQNVDVWWNWDDESLLYKYVSNCKSITKENIWFHTYMNS